MSQEFQVVCNLIAAAISISSAVVAYRARKRVESIRESARTPRMTPDEPIEACSDEACPDTQPSRV